MSTAPPHPAPRSRRPGPSGRTLKTAWTPPPLGVFAFGAACSLVGAWRSHVHAHHQSDNDMTFPAPMLIGVGGSLLSLLLALAIWAAKSNQARAIALAREMTASLAAREAEARAALATAEAYRSALDRHAIVATTDLAGTIKEANDNFCRISGYSREELIGARHSILNSGRHPKEFWVQMWRTISGRAEHADPASGIQATGRGADVWRAEVCNRAKDGSLYWVDSTIGPIRDHAGRAVGYVSIRFDITDRKQAERLLQYSHDNLEQHVAERTQLLAEAVETAEAASRAKSEFLAHMSHEIRTPINGVAGMLELLSGTPLTEQQRRFIDLARTSVVNLTSVINDILDFSKIEAGKLDIVPADFDLLAAVEDVVQMLAHRAQQKGLEITCALQPDIPRCVRGDPDRVRQVLTNLVGNAIKFTKQGAVVVRVVLERPGSAGERAAGPLIRFTVSDTGIGIPQDRLERLFKAFSQADASTTRQYGGTGLGLAICKQLVELMGGAIGVASEEGRGSTFWFTVQFDETAVPASTTQHHEHPLAGRRVLVVGGSASERSVLLEHGSAWRLRMDDAEDAQRGLALLVQAAASGDPFVAAVVDSGLPAAGAFDFAGAVRADPRVAATALLLQHPMTVPIESARFMSSGFATDVPTPVRQSQLFDALMSAVARSPGAQGTPTTPTRQPPPLAAGGDGPKLRVLVAEDNEINRIVVREMLTRLGFHCEVVSNGRLAVDAVFRTRGTPDQYDLALMDCQMPELDGYDATREIRRRESAEPNPPAAGGRLPIVALTANAMQGDRERCLAAGMDAHTSKPINPKQLLLTIDQVLRAHKGAARAA